MQNINVQLLYFINNLATRSAFLDKAVVFTTNYAVYLVLLGVLAYLFIYLPIRIPSGVESVQAISRACTVAAGVAISYIITISIKAIVASPRPFQALAHIHALTPYESGYSFPSAHAAVTAALAAGVYVYHKRLGIILWAFAFIVSFTRVYVGVHYPIDVGVGLLIGFAVPNLIFSLSHRYKKRLAHFEK